VREFTLLKCDHCSSVFRRW